MKIATWNVNSIKVRLAAVLDWLEAVAPDVLLMQEIKCIDENFPALEFESRGYTVAVHGQKTYNGVAIVSRHKLTDIRAGLPGGEDDAQARYIEAWVEAGGVRVASVYLPNGNPVESDKFAYKLAWMERLLAHAHGLLAAERPAVLGGDYNVIPADGDCHDPAAWEGDALTRPDSRARFRALLNLGYTEAWRALHAETHIYSYWDFQGGAWPRDEGVRIDHLLLTPQAADRLERCEIDKAPRGKPKASDHTPVWCELA
ncbi:MAG: exodeoxyribonuclease III [Alphaproteobacteria bacterium]